MTYTQARLIVHNPDAYSKAKVREAAVFILGCLTARREDIHAATYALA